MIQNNPLYPDKFNLFYDYCRKENYMNDDGVTPTIAWLIGFFLNGSVLSRTVRCNDDLAKLKALDIEEEKYFSLFQKDSIAYNDFIKGHSYNSYLRKNDSFWILIHEDISIEDDKLSLFLYEKSYNGDPNLILN